MVLGYEEKVNNIVMIDTNNKRFKRKLGICGINYLNEHCYTYYDTDMQLHIIDMNYAEKVMLYHDKELIITLYQNRIDYNI